MTGVIEDMPREDISSRYIRQAFREQRARRLGGVRYDSPEQCSRPRLVHDQAVTVEAIHLGAARKPELWTVESVRAVAGKGLEGDRHFHADGAAPGQALTLVSAEIVEDVGLMPGETRRQVTVRDVDVNSLVGKRFRVGEVECLGVELCEPCRHLEEMTRPGIIKELTHRGGINADILVGGVIRVGDPVVEL
jgi:MOSC domain-containing protein YiiM